jgi:hypothetical protein
MPLTPVGFVNISGSPGVSCSATLIERDVVLFAAHCFCQNGTQMGNIPSSSITFQIPATGDQPNVDPIAAKAHWLTGFSDDCNNGGSPAGWEAVRDLACAQLSKKVPFSAVPAVVPVVTNTNLPVLGDLTNDIVMNGQSSAAPDYFRVVGYGATSRNGNDFGTRLTGTLPWMRFQDMKDNRGSLLIFDGDIDDSSGGETTIAPVDSGGPLFFFSSAHQWWRQIGVASRVSGTIFGWDSERWAPTFDNGSLFHDDEGIDAGAFIRKYCLHADNPCSDPATPDGTPCDDGNPCTQTDTCQGGACVGSDPVLCFDPGLPCSAAGTCDPDTGKCVGTVAPDGTACDLGDGCWDPGTCQGSVCVGPCTAPPAPYSGGGGNPAASGSCSHRAVGEGEGGAFAGALAVLGLVAALAGWARTIHSLPSGRR